MIRRALMTVTQFCAIFSLVLGAAVHAQQSSAAHFSEDGPYVTAASDGTWIARWFEMDAGAPKVREQRTEVGEALLIPAIGTFPAFSVELREPDAPVPSEAALPSHSALFVMADTHGEFEIAVELLRRHAIIDEQLRWSFGKGRLVILGDVFDRGARQTELLWLIYKLEAEAQSAGGAVHLLLGNHELLLLMGDERYLNPKYVQAARALGEPRYAALWNRQTLLGRWLRTKPAVMKIGNYLCAHGGIAPGAVERNLTLDAINDDVRNVLNGHTPTSRAQAERMRFAIGPAGPLWYRGYLSDMRQQGGPPRAGNEDVTRVLEHFQVKRILVGHTKVPTITALYDGRVIAVQVYPHRDANTGAPIMEALSVEQAGFFKVRADGSREKLVK